MRMLLPTFAFLVCPAFLWAQSPPFPDLSDFTKSPTEHVISKIDEPFRVRSVKGLISTGGDGDIPGRAGILFEIEGPGQERRIRSARTDKHGTFKISGVPAGTYKFKTTLDGLQSVIGTLLVSKHSSKSAIRIKMPFGV